MVLEAVALVRVDARLARAHRPTEVLGGVLDPQVVSHADGRRQGGTKADYGVCVCVCVLGGAGTWVGDPL